MSKTTWPRTEEELLERGYKKPTKPATQCSGHRCTMLVEFWTTPAGKSMPLERVKADCACGCEPVDKLQPHWATCVDSPFFKR